jgi:glycosyltransferase 2 family protein
VKKLPPAAKVVLKLAVGFGVVLLVASQVKLDDELTLERRVGGEWRTYKLSGRDLALNGDVVLDPVFGADGQVIDGSWRAAIEDAQVVKKNGRFEATRRGENGRPETRTGSVIAWTGVAKLSEDVDGGSRSYRIHSAEERVAIREDGKDPVRVSLAAKHGLRGMAGRLFDRTDLLVYAMAFLMLAYVTSAYRWTLLLRSQQLPAAFGRCLSLTFIGFFFNNVMPGLTGGDLVKAVMIAQDHPEYRARAVGTVIVDRIIGLLVLAVISAGVLIFHLDRYREASIAIFGFLGAAVVASVIFLSRRVRRALGLDRLMRKLPGAGLMQKLDQAFFLYRSQKGTLLIACGLSFLAHVGNIGAVYCFGLGVGLDESAGLVGHPLAAYVATVPVAMIVSSIPLLPGGWGVGEAAFAYFFRSVGVWNIDLSIALSVVQRTAALAYSLVGGVLFLTHRKRNLEALHEAEAAGADAATVEGSKGGAA